MLAITGSPSALRLFDQAIAKASSETELDASRHHTLVFANNSISLEHLPTVASSESGLLVSEIKTPSTYGGQQASFPATKKDRDIG